MTLYLILGKHGNSGPILAISHTKINKNELRHEKAFYSEFPISPTQTELYRHRRWRED